MKHLFFALLVSLLLLGVKTTHAETFSKTFKLSLTIPPHISTAQAQGQVNSNFIVMQETVVRQDREVILKTVVLP